MGRSARLDQPALCNQVRIGAHDHVGVHDDEPLLVPRPVSRLHVRGGRSLRLQIQLSHGGISLSWNSEERYAVPPLHEATIYFGHIYR